MKLFAIHPGASVSTADVYNGLVRALRRQEHEVIPFQLDTRIFQSGSWLHWCYKNTIKAGIKMEKPSPADVLYHACGDAVTRALHHECEWMVVVSAMYFPKFFLKIAKRAGIKIALVLTESPYDDEAQLELAPFADVIFTHERTSVPLFQSANPETYYMPHAYDPDIHRLRATNEDKIPAHDVVFVGTGFQERIDLLTAVDWTGTDFGLYGSWTLLGSRAKLRKYLRAREIENDVAASLYHRAKIGLNIHRTSKGFGRHTEKIETAESLNPRSYELAACGLFHFSDWRAELTEIFGDLVPTYRNHQELEELIAKYKDDPKARARIANELPAAVAGHTWDHRAEQLIRRISIVNQRSRLRAS